MNAKPIFTTLALSLAFTSLVPVAQAQTAPACLDLDAGWIRLPPAPRPMLAGFGRLENSCKTEQVVVAARSPAFAEVSIHRTELVDGVSRMREIERLPVAAGKHALLEPGGLHLMLMQPGRTFAEGEQVPLVLELADGSVRNVSLTVRKAAPQAAAEHGAHAH